MARMISTTGATRVVFAGQVYRPDAKGVFRVPDEAAEALAAHGFVPDKNDRAGQAGLKEV